VPLLLRPVGTGCRLVGLLHHEWVWEGVNMSRGALCVVSAVVLSSSSFVVPLVHPVAASKTA
jgi:hypothetical protein